MPKPSPTQLALLCFAGAVVALMTLILTSPW